jgi:3-methylcrotonyl-CoA carboxylase alpha subunit
METVGAAPQPSTDLLSAAAEDAILAHVSDAQSDMLFGLAGFRLNAAAERSARLLVDHAICEAAIDHAAADRYLDAKGWPGVADRYFEDGAFFDIVEARFEGSTAGTSDGALTAPMPGRVVAVEVKAGQSVTKGQRIVVIEAMKMEQALLAPFDGTVAELGPGTGAQVSEGALLARIEPEAQ